MRSVGHATTAVIPASVLLCILFVGIGTTDAQQQALGQGQVTIQGLTRQLDGIEQNRELACAMCSPSEKQCSAEIQTRVPLPDLGHHLWHKAPIRKKAIS